MTYKILFAGLGSIGKRHLNNVVRFLGGRGDEFVIDAIRSGVSDDKKAVKTERIEENLIRNNYTYDDDIKEEYDILFVTNPTSKHLETVQKYTTIATHMFIEKPVFSEEDVNVNELGLNPNSIYYVACPLRYNAVLQYVKENVACDKAIAVRSISSSYLPDWRPGQDYRNTYSAHKSLGGGVSIDLVHEWDYLTWLFDKPTEVKCMIGTHSSLEIDSDDLAIYIGKRDRVSYELHLDYFGRSTIRNLQIFLPEETVEADITNGVVRYLREGSVISLAEARNQYQLREIEHFFNIIEGRRENDNTIENAVSNLRLARGIVS